VKAHGGPAHTWFCCFFWHQSNPKRATSAPNYLNWQRHLSGADFNPTLASFENSKPAWLLSLPVYAAPDR